jgi:leucyl-tRNA synthetase
LEWSESGIDGCWRYINRLWKLFAANENEEQINGDNLSENHEIIKLTHKIISGVKSEYEKNAFNSAIAKIREFSNILEKFEVNSDEDKKIMHFALKNLAILFSPIMPHLAEECYNIIGYKNFVFNAEFPKFNEKLIIDDNVKIALQVCGKLRGVIEVKKDLAKEELEKLALKNENVQKFVKDKEIKRIILVPNKLINIVAV